MRVLNACEESQAGCIAFRDKGHEAYSCDLQECSGGHPEWHIKGDVLNILGGGTFKTQSGDTVTIDKWDMMIGHPYCTYNTNAANKWLTVDSSQSTVAERLVLRDEGLVFFRALLDAPIEKICLENPQPHPYVYTKVGRFQDKVQPWMFGEPETKGLCLWLKNLPPLMSTVIESVRDDVKHKLPPGPERTKLRSKSYPKVMEAMADQWG